MTTVTAVIVIYPPTRMSFEQERTHVLHLARLTRPSGLPD